MPATPTTRRSSSGSGGPRPGAGRPPSLARQVAEARQLQRKLRELTGVGITRLAENYGALMDAVIADALGGDKKARLFLLDLGTKLLRAGDVEDSPLDTLRARELHLHKHEHFGQEPDERTDEKPYTRAAIVAPPDAE